MKKTDQYKMPSKKRSCLLRIDGFKKRWGYFTCQYCKKKIIAYNDDRHYNSELHINNVRKYELENKSTVFHFRDLTKAGINKAIREKFKLLAKQEKSETRNKTTI